MKKALRHLILLPLVFSLLFFTKSTKPELVFEPVALVELFTSQGCSSCPPADAILSKTIEEAEASGKKIFSLSFHVDYWNRLGWLDPFSDKKYSERQEVYASILNPGNIYTPQMIVNGERQFVGSDKNLLGDALNHALNTNASVSFVKLESRSAEGRPLHLEYQIQGNYAGCKIYFALVSLKETTMVKRGENSGRTLENKNIVRQLISVNASESGVVDFEFNPSPLAGNKAVIAFIQHMPDLKIVGAAERVVKETSQ